MHSKQYFIANWDQWDTIIDQSVRSFENRYGATPNLLLASEATFDQIDLRAKRERVTGEEGQRPPEGKFAPLTSFANRAATYRLHFCLGNHLPAQVIELVQDDEAEFVGTDDPDVRLAACGFPV